MRARWLVAALVFAGLFGCQTAGRVEVSAPLRFVHPGALSNAHDLAYVGEKIRQNVQPWRGLFEEVRAFAVASPLTVAPFDDLEQKVEAQRAYANALCWTYTGETRYAEQAIAILNVWATTFPGYWAPEGQSLLQGGWIGALLGPAAELLRDYPGWDAAAQAALKTMFAEAFYPVLNVRSGWNGNVDLTQIDAMLNIAVYCEDAEEFQLGVTRLRERLVDYVWIHTDPPRTDVAFWFAPAKWVDGITQETVRDRGHHSQYGLASALHATEVAWNQGVDLYREFAPRLVPALELLSLQLTSGSLQGLAEDDSVTTDLFDTFEVGYRAYAGRLGLSLPETKRLLETRVRRGAVSDWNIFYESLTHQVVDETEHQE